MSCDDKGLKAASDCTPCSPGLRNRYFRGKLMTVADYEGEQRYMIQRRRMTSRLMLGWGVASGFAIAPDDGIEIGAGTGIRIGEGFALDPRGRELVACEPTTIRGGKDIVWLKQGRCGLVPMDPPQGAEPGPDPAPEPPPAEKGEEGARHYDAGRGEKDGPPAEDDCGGGEPERPAYLLCAHYAERRIDAVIVKEGCGEEICEANRICETVVFSLTRMPECPPGLRHCPASGWAPAEIAQLRWVAAKCDGQPSLADPGDRGPHRTLAQWSMNGPETGALCCEPSLCAVGDGLEIDPNGGVPLACVTLGFHCREPYISAISDSRGPRRLARPNDMLFDLIRGCDLTRIHAVGWSHLLGRPDRSASFEEFAEMFVGGKPDSRSPRPVDSLFWVLFTGPVQVASLSPEAITITLLHWDSDGAVRFVRRLPIVELKVAQRLATDPPDTTRAFQPIVHGNYWLEDIYSSASAFDEREGTIVEIGVRGGMIVDAAGQLVAAGGGYLETRAGWPGSDFISAFTVKAPSASARKTVRRGARH